MVCPHQQMSVSVSCPMRPNPAGIRVWLAAHITASGGVLFHDGTVVFCNAAVFPHRYDSAILGSATLTPGAWGNFLSSPFRPRHL